MSLPVPQEPRGQGHTSIFNIPNDGLTGLEAGFHCGVQAGLELCAQMILLAQPPECLGLKGTGHTTWLLSYS